MYGLRSFSLASRRSSSLTTPKRRKNKGENASTHNPDEGMRPGFTFPRQFRAVPVLNSKIRMIVTGGAPLTVTFNASDLLKIHTVATAANTGYGMARAVRLKYVEIWEPFQGASMNTSLAGIQFYGTGATNTGTNDERFCVAVGTNTPAHLLAYPPKETLVGWWQNVASSLVLFDLKNLEEGCIVDISFDYISGENQTAINLGPYTISGGVLGAFGVHLPSTFLSAVGLNNY